MEGLPSSRDRRIAGLGMDESYTLKVKAPVATVVAPTTWGALRALETFSQVRAAPP